MNDVAHKKAYLTKNEYECYLRLMMVVDTYSHLSPAKYKPPSALLKSIKRYNSIVEFREFEFKVLNR